VPSALARPVGEEAVEDAPDVLLGDAGTFVSHADVNRALVAARDDEHLRREAHRVVEQVLEHLHEAVARRAHFQRLLGEREIERHAVALAHAETIDELPQQVAHVDVRLLLVADLAVDRRDLADLRQQLLHPRDLRLGDAREARPLLRRVDLRQHLRRHPDRRERVLELVRNLGRERFRRALMRLDPARQPLQRARQLADLVALSRAFEAAAKPSAAIEDRARLATQLAQRADDRRRHHQRQHDGDGNRQHGDLEDGQAQLVEVAADLVGRPRDHHRADRVAVAVDRHRHVQHHLLVDARRHALFRRRHAEEGFLDFVAAEDVGALVLVGRHQRRAQFAHRAERLLEDGGAGAIEPVVAHARVFVVDDQRAGVDDDLAVRIDDAEPPVARPPLLKQCGPDIPVWPDREEGLSHAALEDADHQMRLPQHRLGLRALARLLVRDEEQRPRDREEDEKDVEQHQPQRDARRDAGDATHYFAPDSGW